MAELVPWLVLTHPNEGLTDPDVERAKWLMDRSAMGIERAINMSVGIAEEPPCA